MTFTIMNFIKHAQPCNKSINSWLLRVTLDLSALTSGLVAKNRARGRSPSALFLVTRPEARAYKSNVTLGTMN